MTMATWSPNWAFVLKHKEIIEGRGINLLRTILPPPKGRNKTNTAENRRQIWNTTKCPMTYGSLCRWHLGFAVQWCHKRPCHLNHPELCVWSLATDVTYFPLFSIRNLCERGIARGSVWTPSWHGDGRGKTFSPSVHFTSWNRSTCSKAFSSRMAHSTLKSSKTRKLHS